VQADPINPKLKAPGPKRLKLHCDILLSNFAFNFNLRRYIPLIRLDDEQEWAWFHKFQALYVPFVWPMLYWAAQVGDFVNIFVNRASPGVEYLGLTNKEVAMYVVGKVMHLGLTLVLPAYYHGLAKTALPFLVGRCRFTLSNQR